MADDPVAAIRRSYDGLAADYARRLFDELRDKPLDRALLDRLAEELRGQGEICDLGCGPGQVARHLQAAGLPVFGVDLSPGMVAEACRLNPGIRFRAGDMLALDLPSGSLAGIVAFYAIVNLPKPMLPRAFREMARVLRPGGLLLLSFHAGDDVISPGTLWDVPITMDFVFFLPMEISAALAASGFSVEEIIERAPYPEIEYPSRRAYVFARKGRAAAG